MNILKVVNTVATPEQMTMYLLSGYDIKYTPTRTIFSLDGQIHRDDAPAICWADGDRWWYQNGHVHRTDGPAIAKANGTMEWCLNTKADRMDSGPTTIYSHGMMEWRTKDRLHRLDGPAIIYEYGDMEWHIDGTRYGTYEEWLAEVKNIQANPNP